MEILQMSPEPAYPPDSGAPHRIHGLIQGREHDDQVWRYASDVHRLRNPLRSDRLVYISDNYSEYTRYALSKYLSTGVFTIPPLDAFYELGTTSNHQLMKISAGKWLKRRIPRSDIIQVEFPWQFKYVEEKITDSQLLVYSSHNDEAEYYEFTRKKRWPVGEWLWKRIRDLDRYAVERSDLTIVVSERDANNYIGRGYDLGEYHVAPNVAPEVLSDEQLDRISPSRPAGITEDATMAVFVGIDVPANVEAVEILCDVAGEIADAGIEICVIGTVGQSFDAERVPDNVHLLGYVDELRPYLVAADIALNPILSGGGSNIKLPEALAYGLPTVTTPFGARSHPVEDGRNLLIADVEEFPETIRRLATDPTLRERLRRSARELAKSELRWEVVSGELFDRYRTMI